MKRYLLIAFISILTMLSAQVAAQDSPKRCQGTTTKGQQCKNRVKEGNYCHYHDPKRTMCGEKTSKGTPCKNPVKKSGEKCWRHV